MAKKKKIRADFRKNRGVRARTTDWTRRYRQHGFEEEAPPQSERISGKGELARRRTVCGEQQDGQDEPGLAVHLDVDEKLCRRGRVLCVLGLDSMVEDQEGDVYRCATRRLLKTLATDQRHVVAAGDRVLFRPVENTDPKEGFIERVEPRKGCICRASPRAAASPGGQRRPVGHRRQRRRAAAEAEPDRPPAGGRRKRGRTAAGLHQQDRPGGPGRPGAFGGRVRPDGLRSAAAERENRFRRRAVPPGAGGQGQRGGRTERRGKVFAA